MVVVGSGGVGVGVSGWWTIVVALVSGCLSACGVGCSGDVGGWSFNSNVEDEHERKLRNQIYELK